MAIPKKKPNRLGKPPESQADTGAVANNLSKPATGELVPLNFKVDAEFRRELKSFAAGHDMSMVEVVKKGVRFVPDAKRRVIRKKFGRLKTLTSQPTGHNNTD